MMMVYEGHDATSVKSALPKISTYLRAKNNRMSLLAVNICTCTLITIMLFTTITHFSIFAAGAQEGQIAHL